MAHVVIGYLSIMLPWSIVAYHFGLLIFPNKNDAPNNLLVAVSSSKGNADDLCV